jgi:hypothetical protein
LDYAMCGGDFSGSCFAVGGSMLKGELHSKLVREAKKCERQRMKPNLE